MFPETDTKFPSEVELEIQSVFHEMFPDADRYFVQKVFTWANACFTGQYRDYQAIDARYHDFEHTLQGALCLARLLYRRHAVSAIPVLPQKMFELGLLAILLHDTGYLKKKEDTEGTGAKYTLIHVSRSSGFAALLLGEKGYSAPDIRTIQHMIRCTGVNVDLKSIPFDNELDRLVGFGLGTADLLGQMAANDYVPKLPILYAEFAESARYNDGKMTSAGSFASAEDLMRKTPLFWEHYVRPKIERDFEGLYRFLNMPFPDGPNYYLDRIKANIARLQQQMAMRAA